MARKSTTYRPFRVTFIAEHGERVVWDTYPSRAAAQKAIREDADCFGLIDAKVEFRGRWSRYPTQDREIERMDDIDGLVESIRLVRRDLSKRVPDGRLYLDGRSRNTHTALVQGYERRLAWLQS